MSAHVKDLSKCECVSTNLGNKIFFGFVTLFFRGFNSETNPSSQLMETEHKSSISIMRLSISSIKQRLLGIRTSAVPELL